MPSSEAQLRRELHNYAIELRRLAYNLPNGVGEYPLLQLSERMSAAAEDVIRSEHATGLAGQVGRVMSPAGRRRMPP